MTNNEIFFEVWNNINIRGICVKNNCYNDIDEIEQMVYYTILNYDNKKLNQIHKRGALLSFCYRTTTNIISNKYNYNNRFVDIYDFEFWDEDENDNEKFDWLMEQISTTPQQVEGMTIGEQNKTARKLLLGFKYKQGLTNKEMAEKFGMSRTYMGKLLRRGIEDIREDWKKGEK